MLPPDHLNLSTPNIERNKAVFVSGPVIAWPAGWKGKGSFALIDENGKIIEIAKNARCYAEDPNFDGSKPNSSTPQIVDWGFSRDSDGTDSFGGCNISEEIVHGFIFTEHDILPTYSVCFATLKDGETEWKEVLGLNNGGSRIPVIGNPSEWSKITWKYDPQNIHIKLASSVLPEEDLTNTLSYQSRRYHVYYDHGTVEMIVDGNNTSERFPGSPYLGEIIEQVYEFNDPGCHNMYLNLWKSAHTVELIYTPSTSSRELPEPSDFEGLPDYIIKDHCIYKLKTLGDNEQYAYLSGLTKGHPDIISIPDRITTSNGILKTCIESNAFSGISGVKHLDISKTTCFGYYFYMPDLESISVGKDIGAHFNIGLTGLKRIYSIDTNQGYALIHDFGDAEMPDVYFTNSNGKATELPAKHRFGIGRRCFIPGGSMTTYSDHPFETINEMWVVEIDKMNNLLRVSPKIDGLTINNVSVNGGEPMTYIANGIYTFDHSIPTNSSDSRITNATSRTTTIQNINVSYTLHGDHTVATSYDDTFVSNMQSKDLIEMAGISDIVYSSDPEIADVYNIYGICVKHNANKSDINNLPAGLYIVGGKKVFVTTKK